MNMSNNKQYEQNKAYVSLMWKEKNQLNCLFK